MPTIYTEPSPRPRPTKTQKRAERIGARDDSRKEGSCAVERRIEQAPSTAIAKEGDKATLVTPSSSFHELRRVSVLQDDIIESQVSTESSIIQLPCSEVAFVYASDVTHSVGSADFGECDTSRFAAPSKTSVSRLMMRHVSGVDTCCIDDSHKPTRDTNREPNNCDVALTCMPTESLMQNKSDCGVGLWVKFFVFFSLFLTVAHNFLTPAASVDDPRAIYVPGGGFSGFWYTLGRLNSIEDPLSHTYYCYSAGCLGVVSMLSNITMETAYSLASDAQLRWQRGELSRFDVTESFVNGLLSGEDDAMARPQLNNTEVLSTLKVLTSEREEKGGVKMAVRTPVSHVELKDMLIQSAWIPFVLAPDLWHDGHMDGGFTLHRHPKCGVSLGYGFDWDIILNALNVNLGYDKVEHFWQKGHAHGIHTQ